MGTANDDGVNVNPFNSRAADYGPLFYDHTHVLVFNYVYNLPKFVKSHVRGGQSRRRWSPTTGRSPASPPS